MNDRFKFRFYDKQCKMYLSDGHYINGDKWMDDYYEDVYDLPEYIIPEQCTGLKDKNGNLIYEGDIVKYWWNQKTNTGTIFWNNEFARFCIANNETHCPEDSNCLMFVADKKIIEIIGNIHEQPEQKDKR